MKIISAKPRRDGKFAVTLLFTMPGWTRTLRKVLTRQEFTRMMAESTITATPAPAPPPES